MKQNTIVIEKGIPIPKETRNFKQELLSMEIGDSFLLPDNLQITNVRSTIHDLKPTGHIYITRKTAEGFRIWRTA